MNNRQAVCHEGFKSLRLILDQLSDRGGITPKKYSLGWADQALSGSYYPTSQIPLLPTAPSEGL